MSGPLSAPPRYVAFSLVDGRPIAASQTVKKVLETASELAAFGIGHHPLTEVLDCGGQAEAVRRGETGLAGARARFPTVYRAGGTSDPSVAPPPADDVPEPEEVPR